MQRLARGLAAALAVAMSSALVGCGAAGPEPRPTGIPQTVQECRDQWHEVGQSVLGLDEDPNPSGLASRWNSITATIAVYENTEDATGCQASIESQITAISLLRAFNDRLRRYDMEFQLSQAAAAIDLYLNADLPAPVAAADGTLVAPPTKKALRAAAATLSEYAPAANAELQPGWLQLATVELTEDDAVAKALGDLDQLAQASPSWVACEAALRVVVAAITAQEGGTPSPGGSPTPTGGATPSPSASSSPGPTPDVTPSPSP